MTPRTPGRIPAVSDGPARSAASPSHFLLTEKYGAESGLQGRFYFGDNLGVLAHLKEESAGCFDFIYTDPPFFTGNTYLRQVVLTAGPRRQLVHLMPAYQDTWEGGITQYLEFLAPRLSVVHALLSPRGNFVIHLDWRAASHVRLLLDEIFGSARLMNQIVWYKGFRGTRAKRVFQHAHDILLWYSKSDQYWWRQSYEPYRDQELRRYNRVDEEGRRYARIKRRQTDGSVYYGRTYPGTEGKWRNDVIADIPTMAATSRERTGFPTQKPLRLLELLLETLAPPGGLVGDFFCGTGTTLVAAARSGRPFVGADSSPVALHLVRARLLGEKIDLTLQVFRSSHPVCPPPKSSHVLRRADGRIEVKLPQQQAQALEWWAVGPGALPFRPLWRSTWRSRTPPEVCSDPLPEGRHWVLLAFHDGTELWSSL